MKKIFSLILALLALVCVFPISAGAASSDISLYGFRNYDESGNEFAFVSFSPSNPKEVKELSKQGSLSEIYCGAFLGGVLYTVDENGVLYAVDTEKFSRNEIGVAIEDLSAYRPVEMAYDITEEKMYLLCLELNNNSANVLFTLDLKTAAIKKVTHIVGASQLKGLSFNGRGVLYGIGQTGVLYKIDIALGRAYTLGSTGYESSYIQSMCFDRTTGLIYWAYYDGDDGLLLSINPNEFAVKEIGAIGKNCEITALSMATDAYALNVEAEDGGIAYVNGEKYYNAGEKASLVAEVTKGYTFGGWKVTKGTLETTGEMATTVIMPADDITVSAFFLPKKVYSEKTLYCESAKTTLWGKKIYYNAQFAATPLKEGMDEYTLLVDKAGDKRQILFSENLILKAFAVDEVESYKGSLKITIPLSEEYEGKKVNVFFLNENSVSKTAQRVKDGKITVKTNNIGSVAVTTYRGTSFFAVFFLIVLIGAFLFFLYKFRKTIFKSLKKDLKKINNKAAQTKKEKENKTQSENILAALDEQDLENSRYNIQ